MSTPISITIPHKLGKAAAKARIQSGFGEMRKQMGSGISAFTEEWADDRLSFSGRTLGQTLSGRLDVLEEAVRIEIDLPDFLAGIANVILGKVKKQGQLLLEKK
jgi:hypothetical protein